MHTTQALEKSKLNVRWLVLLLLSLLMTGNYYCYDNPAALYTQLSHLFSGVAHFDLYFDALYSVYSLPNIVLPLVGGVIVDRAGVVFSLNLFTCLCLTGQVVVASACAAGSFEGMLVGRAIFGLGGESLSVAQSAFVTVRQLRSDPASHSPAARRTLQAPTCPSAPRGCAALVSEQGVGAVARVELEHLAAGLGAQQRAQPLDRRRLRLRSRRALGGRRLLRRVRSLFVWARRARRALHGQDPRQVSHRGGVWPRLWSAPPARACRR